YFAWFITALLSVGGDANDQNLPQSGRLLYCVISGFINTYPDENLRRSSGWMSSSVKPFEIMST
ncbi:MAG: hypothetical protein WA741_30785, partial [Candidatus Sulfotelmatobacter sp.]